MDTWCFWPILEGNCLKLKIFMHHFEVLSILISCTHWNISENHSSLSSQPFYESAYYSRHKRQRFCIPLVEKLQAIQIIPKNMISRNLFSHWFENIRTEIFLFESLFKCTNSLHKNWYRFVPEKMLECIGHWDLQISPFQLKMDLVDSLWQKWN